MAIFHSHVQIITRGKGKSAVGAAAYRAGESIKNEYDGITHDYTKKGGIVHTEILLPNHAPRDFLDRSSLWNAVEKIEKSGNSQLARELEIALPRELSLEQNISLARRYVEDTFVSAGMCADLCIHDKGDSNPHMHIMLTMRPINDDGTWGVKQKKEYVFADNGSKQYDPIKRQYKCRPVPTTDWNKRAKADEWRKAWEDIANAELRRFGFDSRIDRRTYAEQGIDKIPTVHMGAAATQMEQRGISTELGDKNRDITISNKEIKQLKARINKLRNWLESEEKSSTPTLADVISEMLDSRKTRTQYSQIRDLKAAAKTLVFVQENSISTIEDLHAKIKSFYSKQMAMGSKLNKLSRRTKTLDEHIKHGEIYRKFKGKKLAPDSADRILFDASKRYLEKALNGHPLNLKKWKDERESLHNEMKILNGEYEKLKGDVREVEVIRRFAETLVRDMNNGIVQRDIQR